VEVVFDLVEHFPEARISGGAVERRMLEIDYRPRYGLSAKVEPGQTTELRFEQIPETAWRGAELVLWLGHHDYYARKNARGPAEVVVDLDEGAVRMARRVELSSAMQKLVLATPPSPPAGRATHALRIAVSAESAPNHFVGVLGRLERVR
jgi:hypothetical protein